MLWSFLSGRGLLQASLYGNPLGSFDAESNLISTDLQDGNFDFVCDDDLLVFLTAKDQHSDIPPKKSSHTYRDRTMAKKYIDFLLKMCSSAYSLQFYVIFWHNKRVFDTMKYLLRTTCLIFLV